MKRPDRVRVAAVQAAPVYLDTAGTLEIVCSYIHRAGREGARLVVFPESFVSGYPYWNWCLSPLQGVDWHLRYYRSAVNLDDGDLDSVCDAARQNGVYVVLGVNEASPINYGTLYNTNVVIAPDGTIAARLRKMVPTFAEKLTWSRAEEREIQIYGKEEIGGFGVLACGENTNTLARFALLQLGEMVHVANFIAFPFNNLEDMVGAIKIRAGAHSFEGKIFTVVACSTISEEMIEELGTTPEIKAALRQKNNALSGVLGPDGKFVVEPLVDDEGMIVADLDLSLCVAPKLFHNIIGDYNRFDMFDFGVRAPGSREPHSSGQSGRDLQPDLTAKAAATGGSHGTGRH